jgi:NADH-quinone oxidoreductase subunit H
MLTNLSNVLTAGASVLGQIVNSQTFAQLNEAANSVAVSGYAIQIGTFTVWPIVSLILLSLVKTVVVVCVMLGFVSYSVVAERRFSAAIQDRVGPNRTGLPLSGVTILGFTIPTWRLLGLGQPIPDSLKLLLKEEFTPAGVNKFYFILAPALAMAPSIITICIVPYACLVPIHIAFSEPFNFLLNIPAPGVIANINVGVLFAFAIASLGVYGIVLAGWSSNSKYPFLGSVRTTAQMISYEVSMGLSVIPLFLIFQELNLSKIVSYQATHGWLLLPLRLDWTQWLLWPCVFVSFITFLIAAFAETNRLPFDFPECETELVGGYHTEYSSMKFALFFLGEYAAMIVTSCLMVTLFLGGWSWITPESWTPWFYNPGDGWMGLVVTALQAVTFLVKMALFLFLFIWVRWTLPRFRYDQLMSIGWKVLLPVALVNILVTAILLAVIQYVH